MISIILPTYNHLEDLLKPCVLSLQRFTDLSKIEVIVVANGCTDGTEEWVKTLGSPFKLLSFPEPLGFTKATNEGIKVSSGEYLIFLNNDCEILYGNNTWIDMLLAPFLEDPKMGVTGPLMNHCPHADVDFIVGFCFCVSRKALQAGGGLLDEIFNPGYGEDTDLCCKVREAGFQVKQVPTNEKLGPGNGTSFPIWHKNNKTFGDMPDYTNKIVKRNSQTLYERYSLGADEVTVEVSTKGRTNTTLQGVIQAIASQTKKPKKLFIYDDNDEFNDLRGLSPYSHLFPLLMSKGIQWYHLPGGRKGQVWNHQSMLVTADTKFVWRLDDDNYPEPNCLENLLKAMKPDVGAVGGLVLDPNAQGPKPSFASNKIEDIYTGFNEQWYRFDGQPYEVDHLYSTFLYRVDAAKKAGGYCAELSPVGHREETMFTYQIKKAGYKVLLTPQALTWHLREGTGGIRSYTDGSLWAKDEAVFSRKLTEWGIKPKQCEVIVLDNGIGDHIMFKSILPDIIKKHVDKKIVLCCCHPEIFETFIDVKLASIGDAIAAFKNLDQWNMYKWCDERNWKGSFVDAMKARYL